MTDSPSSRSRGSSRWFFFVFLGGLGALFGYYAWSQASGYRALVARGQPAEAVIIRYEEARGRRSTTWYPVFRFETGEGRRVEATSAASADPGALRRGSRVAVVYDAADPSNVRHAAAVQDGMGVTPWILGVLSLLMFAGAAVFLLPERRPKA